MRRLPPFREAARSFAVLLAVSGLAVAQPVLDLFGHSPETFVFVGADAVAIVTFGVIVVLAPAVLGLTLELVAGVVHPPARQVTHVILVAVFTAAWIIQLLWATGSWPAAVVVAFGVLAGVGLGIAYRTVPAVRPSLSYLAIAPLLFLGLFLFSSPVSDLVITEDAETAGDIEADTPVVLLVLDELPLSTLLDPDGRIDADLFPNFAAFAGGSTWYRNATTTQGLTLRAVPAVFSGQDIGLDGPSPVWSNYPDSLFTLFGGSYTLNVSEAVSQLCAPSLCASTRPDPGTKPIRDLLDEARSVWFDRLGGSDGSDELLDQFAESAGSRPTIPVGPEDATVEVSPERFDDFLDRFEGIPDRSLSVMHLILPHGPFKYLPTGHTYADADAVSTGLFYSWPDNSPWPALLGRQRHVLQTQYTDRLLGRFLDRLRDTGLYDRAVVALTADHGANFAPGAVYRGPDDTTYEQIMWVPMMIKSPGQTEGVIDDSNVTNLDVLPTIAELAEVHLPFEVDGASAVGGAAVQDDTKRFYRSNQPPYLPDPEAVLEYGMDEGAARVRDRIYPSMRQGDPAWWPYQVGDHAGLIGEPVTTLTIGAPDEAEVTLDNGQREALAEVDLEDQVRPVFVSGVVGPQATGEVVVVVVVNGRVAGVSPIWLNFVNESRFAVMIPEMLLGPTNELELFLISPDNTGAEILHPLTE